jgi:hypothetical protein
MPSEQSPSSNARPSRAGSAEKDQHPPIVGGVRGLLGLPMCETGLLTTAPLTAPSGGHHYEQPPWPESEENDESFHETVRDEELIEAGGSGGTLNDYPGSLPRNGASFPRAIPRKLSDTRSALSPMSVEHRDHASFVIPGVSTHRPAFPALSETADTPTISVEGEPRDAISQPAAPLNAPVSLPRAREMTTSDVELLTRLEQLVTDGVKAQKSSEVRTRSSAPRSPGLPEQMGMENAERAGQDLAQRFEQLQRTVRELAATVSSQAARNRDESQLHSRDQKKTPLQRMVIIKRSEGASTTPRAFWERSRLGRFYLRTGR